MKKLIVLSILTLTIISCGKKGGATDSTYVPASPEEEAWHTNCSKCHSLKRATPAGHTSAEWSKIVDKMQHKRGKEHFTDDQKVLILKYLNAGAKTAG
jgi:hypothetical protein